MFLHILLFLPSARSIKMRMQNFSVFDWSVLLTWPKWPSIFEIWYCFPWFLLFTFSFLIRSVIRKFHQLNCRISIRWPKLTNQEARICVFAYTAILPPACSICECKTFSLPDWSMKPNPVIWLEEFSGYFFFFFYSTKEII